MTTYFKSALVGIFTALVAVIIVVLAMLRVWMSGGGGSGGMVGMYVSLSSWQILLAAVVGFAAGFWFTLRRARTRHA